MATVAAATLFLVACGGISAPESSASPSALPMGGTLRLAVPHDIVPPSALASSDPDIANNALDPHFLPWYDSQELQRCCLARTLLSYAGFPTDRDGTVLRPDLAASLPEVSADELTWTFRLQPGIHYAPPLDEVEVTSADFVRMLHRVLPTHAQLSGFATLTQLGIVGVPEFLAGEASSVSGVETPDQHTLRIRLVRPAGDLPARFAVSDTAPIPPSPSDPAAPLGIATGHDDDYGRFMVGTDPYMVEGSERMDLTLPPPAAGTGARIRAGYRADPGPQSGLGPHHRSAAPGLCRAHRDRHRRHARGRVRPRRQWRDRLRLQRRLASPVASRADRTLLRRSEPRARLRPLARHPALRRDEPCAAAVRRHPCAKGGQSGDRQGGPHRAGRRAHGNRGRSHGARQPGGQPAARV